MDKAIIDFRSFLLQRHSAGAPTPRFDPTNAKIVMEWLIAAENRRPVVLVGAGFSRNARHKHRKDDARPHETPLWWELSERMAVHLQVPRDKYDAPTMADMYVASFGDGELRDLLKSMLPDDDLEPGAAHRALASYRAEAVITTNFLDTLLDTAKHEENDRWNRVIADADLSSSTKTGAICQDLIYFHGHRCASDTWVMTRSQYEDVARKKPVIVARVRQLMAQHPLLIVGFGLSDPNFHNLYRQVSADMRRNQPLGLAIQLTDVSEAERRHWDELGIRIAVPADAAMLKSSATKSNEFFEWLFKRLATSWPPDEEVILDYACEPDDPGERLERIDGLLRHPWRGHSEEDEYEGKSRRFAAWREVLFSTLSDEDKERAVRASRNAASVETRNTPRGFATATGGAKIKVPAGLPDQEALPEVVDEFLVLPKNWDELRPTDQRTWQLDSVLSHMSTALQPAAQHFALGLELDLYRTERAEDGFIPWIPLTFYLGVRAGASDLAKLAADCIASAAKFGDERWIGLVQEEAKKAGVVAVLTDAGIQADSGSLENDGFLALMDGNFEVALKKYAGAADRARGENWEFKEWAWRIGERHALAGLTNPFGSAKDDAIERKEQLERQLKACGERIKRLESTKVVRGWLRLATERIQGALEHALEQRESRAQRRAHGGSGFSFSRSPYMAWRSFRELESIDAPPRLQVEYLLPLLWDHGFKVESELEYRAKFDLKETREWVRDVVDAPSADVDAQTKRDATLMEAFIKITSSKHSKTERSGQLSAFPGLDHAIRPNDIDALVSWLPAVFDALGQEVETNAKWRHLSREHTRALGTLAAYCSCLQVRTLFERWNRVEGMYERIELTRALLGFPWFRWARTESNEVAAWLRSIAGTGVRGWLHGEENIEQRSLDTEHEMLVFAMYTMLAELLDSAPAAVDEELKTQLLNVSDEIRAAPVARERSWEIHRGGYLLERELLGSTMDEQELFERWSSAEGWDSPNSSERLKLRWCIVADALLDKRHMPHEGALVETLKGMWADIEAPEKWAPIERFHSMNPHHAEPLIRFLVSCLIGLVDKRDVVAERLLSLFASAPSELEHAAPTLSPSVWGKFWATLVGRVLASAGGDAATRTKDSMHDRSGAATEHLLGAIGLWAEYLRRARRGFAVDADPELDLLLQPLRAAALLALSDERTLIANHAAYAVVAAAEVETKVVDAELLAEALRRIGSDTRVIVRMAAAYAGSRLPLLATSERVREVAVSLRESLAGDPNAQIGAQRRWGELQAQYELQRRQQ
ncbi:MAG TPA: SIR2 family protein [Polyangiaceae bacterium]|jgi:hypothetical protein